MKRKWARHTVRCGNSTCSRRMTPDELRHNISGVCEACKRWLEGCKV